MNVIKLLKTITTAKVVIGSAMMTDTVKHLINYHEENVINLTDTDSSSSSSEESKDIV